MSKTRILLVDDNKEFVRLLSQRIRARGIDVETAYSGLEALEKVEHSRFDAILLDIVMPGLDGIATLRRLRKVNPGLQVILLTGHATIKKSVTAMKLGAMDFLEKPTDLQELMLKIEEASTKAALEVEKRIEKELDDIVGRRGW